MKTFFFILIACAFTAAAADWPQFRGPKGDGKSSEETAPLEWGAEKNIRWRTPLPGPGNGSPIVSHGRVFIACAEDKGRKRYLICFDPKSGDEIWKRTVEIDEVMPTHKTNLYGGSTPAADGERVVVWHSTAGLVCYDFGGEKLWERDLGEFRHMWGYGGSPILHKGKVLLFASPGKRVFMTALDLESGKTLWETDEPVHGTGEYNAEKQYTGAWTTPVIATIDGTEQAICATTTRVNGYDIKSGKILWTCDGIKGRKGELAYSSPVLADGICVQIAGFGGPSIGFKLGGKGNITGTNRLWQNDKNPQCIGSGVYVNGHVFIPDAAGGTIRCLDPKTGKETWKERADGPNHWGSIVMAADRLYVTNQSGATIVFAPNPKKFEKLAVNKLGEECNSTPAVSDGVLFIRTFDALYCIEEKGDTL